MHSTYLLMIDHVVATSRPNVQENCMWDHYTCGETNMWLCLNTMGVARP